MSGAIPVDSLEIWKDKLYVCFTDHPPTAPSGDSSNVLFVAHDKSLVYSSFFADFGPLDLGQTVRFCHNLHEEVARANQQRRVVVYCCPTHPHQRSNACVLLCAYQIFILNYTVEQAYAPFIGINPGFVPFRDAGFCINTFPISVLDCARAMKRAANLDHFNIKSFSIANFQHMAKLQHGDLSWIVPGKFLAFSGPIAKRRQLSPGVFSLTPEEYVPILKNLGVTCIVRFNSKCYDRNVYIMNGIRHVDLLYEDGGNPTEAILQAFLQVCEAESGAIAVHCKAGLGRTGTNIAAYMMKHFGYTAKEATAWCRICRPGSVVGPQQQYLVSIEAKMFSEGKLYRQKHGPPLVPGATAKRRGSGSRAVAGMTPLSVSSRESQVVTPPLVSPRGTPKNAKTESLFKPVAMLSTQSDPAPATNPRPTGNNNAADKSSHRVDPLFQTISALPSAETKSRDSNRRPSTSAGPGDRASSAALLAAAERAAMSQSLAVATGSSLGASLGASPSRGGGGAVVSSPTPTASAPFSNTVSNSYASKEGARPSTSAGRAGGGVGIAQYHHGDAVGGASPEAHGHVRRGSARRVTHGQRGGSTHGHGPGSRLQENVDVGNLSIKDSGAYGRAPASPASPMAATYTNGLGGGSRPGTGSAQVSQTMKSERGQQQQRARMHRSEVAQAYGVTVNRPKTSAGH